MARFVYDNVTFRKRSRLPHLEIPGGLYFVTFSLKDAVRPAVYSRASRDREREERLAARIPSAERKSRMADIDRSFRLTIEAELDAAQGRCLFSRASRAAIVAETLAHDDRVDYELGAWVIMPNHVHVLFRLLFRRNLGKVMQTWKSVSSHMINSLDRATGSIWERDYFDTTMRGTRHLERSVRYVLDNPGKAGLRDWKWVFLDRERYGEWMLW